MRRLGILLGKLGRRTRSLFLGRHQDSELAEEIQFHLEMEEEALIQAGLEPAEARRQARISFGGVEKFHQQTRDVRGLRPLEDFVSDLRHGWRTLARRPAYSAAILLTLAIGVGGSATIFGAVRGILLRPLPYLHGDQVLVLGQNDRLQNGALQEASPANFLDWRARSKSFETLTAMEPFGLDWLSPEGPIYLSTWLVYEGFFETFGTPPLLGRTFHPEEYARGRNDVVVLGYQLWQQRFGGDQEVIGRVESLDGRPQTIIGVMPPGFQLPSNQVTWTPKVLDGWESQSRGGGFYQVFGRLRDGVTEQEARGELDTIALGLEEEHPQTNANVGIATLPLPQKVLGKVRPILLLLLGAVAFVLAIVAANITSVQLARSASRGREFAVRDALGAGWGRLARQLLTEGLLLAGLGALIGFVVAKAALPIFRGLAPRDLPRLDELAADRWVFGFAVLTSLLATLSTSLVPLAVAARSRLRASMLRGGRGDSRGRLLSSFQGSLVVAQIALSLILVIGAGLLLKSFATLLAEDRGFRVEGIASLTVQSWSYFDGPKERGQFVREVVDGLSALPGVKAAGMTSAVPLQESIDAERTVIDFAGRALAGSAGELPKVQFSVVTEGFFSVLGARLLAGRLIAPSDDASQPPVVLVNEAFVERFLPGIEAVGERVIVGQGENAVAREVVGVVSDVRRRSLSESALPGLYIPHGQSPTGANAFLVRAHGPASEALRQIKQVIQTINPAISVYQETTMEELVGASVRDRRFLLALVAGFAFMALGLAAAGIFGLMSYSTMARSREIGVRMAFGAGRGSVVGMVLSQALRLATFGVILGILGSLLLTRWLAGMLYEVTPLDPMTFAIGAFVLLSSALIASWVPARRAARTDPVHALRAD
ncbi:MAG: ABC transporter permease [Deltaproteobacteria bacterium]|nr:ABC transporter permease [Deltaproteobacteria bacterium]